MSRMPINNYERYHAHIYFDEHTSEIAKQLRTAIDQRFDLPIGRFHERPVGPHPLWSCQVAFNSEDFDQFIPWLEENRQGLTVFVHALTGDDLSDHTDHAYWLGEAVALKLAIFKKN